MPLVWHKVVHFSVCNSLEGLTEMGEPEMHFEINILQGHACDEGIKQGIILTRLLR